MVLENFVGDLLIYLNEISSKPDYHFLDLSHIGNLFVQQLLDHLEDVSAHKGVTHSDVLFKALLVLPLAE